MYALNFGLQGVQPIGIDTGLADPLRTITAISNLIRQGTDQGFSFRLNTDFAELARLRQELRSSDISPMFDPQACRSLSERGFWMSVADASGKASTPVQPPVPAIMALWN